MTRPALIPIATSLVIAVFSLSLAANSEFDEQYELDVQTYGVYQEFGSPLYALKLETQNEYNNASELLAADETKALSMRVLSNSIGTRQWCRFWTQNIAINSDSDTLERLTDPLLQMCDSIEGALVNGDQIDFLRESPTNTKLRINNNEIAELEGEGLFETFLSPFLGFSPVSGELKDNLLQISSADTDLYDAYATTITPPERIEITNSWANIVPAPAPVLAPATVPEPEPIASPIEPPIEQTEIAIATTASEPPNEADRSEETAIAQTPQLSTPEDISLPNPAASEEQPSEPLNTDITASTEASITTELLANLNALEQVIEPVEEPEPIVRISPLEIQQYQSESLRQVYANVTYPRNAVRRNQEGRIRFNVRINPLGEITQIQALELTEHNLLNEAAEEAIIDSSPFAPPPLEADEEFFDLILPIVFQLQ